MTAVREVGYDGKPITIELVRDIQGKGKREQVRQVRYDSVERLFRQKSIEDYQYQAARKLQRDASAAELRARSSPDGVHTSRTLYELSDAQMNAMAVHADGIRAVQAAIGKAGGPGEVLLRLVVIEDWSLTDAARSMRMGADRAGGILVQALHSLARHYGLVS